MPNERCDKIKQVGFENIALYYADDFVSANGTVKQIICAMQNKHLKFDALHFSFVKSGDIWAKNLTGYKYYTYLKKLIKKAKNFGVTNFVMHLNDERNVPSTTTGLKRIENLLKLCKKYNFNIAFENLPHSNSHIDTIAPLLEKYSNAKICYDIGHGNITKFDAEKYVDKISVFHLHDNHGTKDEHNIPFDGNIDWNQVFEIIKKCNNPLLVIETHSRTTLDEQEEQKYLKNCYQSSLKILQNIQ